jgi:hypothetical protein
MHMGLMISVNYLPERETLRYPIPKYFWVALDFNSAPQGYIQENYLNAPLTILFFQKVLA